MTRVSVCMATYNGAQYLHEQLASIIEQLHPDDEVVIVDDASSDATVSIIERFDDPRIRLVRNEKNLGYVRTFERAMGLATGDVLLLSDQDDVWAEGRRDALMAAAGTGVAAGNLLVLGSSEPLKSPLNGRAWVLRAEDGSRGARNIALILAGNIPYFGSAMAVHRDAMPLVHPFPEFLYESHDLWIAVAANMTKQMTHLEQTTLYRRYHDANASSPKPRGAREVLRSRVLLMRLMREARRRARALAREQFSASADRA